MFSNPRNSNFLFKNEVTQEGKTDRTVLEQELESEGAQDRFYGQGFAGIFLKKPSPSTGSYERCPYRHPGGLLLRNRICDSHQQ